MHLTPLLRNYCFFGVSPIFLTQYPVMLRDTAGEKGYKQTDEMSFSTPPSLRATSPIFCVTKHPVILRDTAGRSFTIAPIVKTETPCNVPNHSKKGVLTPFCRIIFFRMRYFPSSVWRSNRRSARRARGLTLTVKNLMKSFYCFFGASPILGQLLFIGRFRNYLFEIKKAVSRQPICKP